jgi:hypothetical protein
MYRKDLLFARLALAVLQARGCLALRPDATPRPSLRGAMKRLPPTTLWVWERPENLSRIDPATTAIAFLDQTVRIGGTISSISRRQPMSYLASAVRIAVVRIEVEAGTDLEREGGLSMAQKAGE